MFFRFGCTEKNKGGMEFGEEIWDKVINAGSEAITWRNLSGNWIPDVQETRLIGNSSENPGVSCWQAVPEALAMER